MGLAKMLRIYFLQQWRGHLRWYNPSDPAAEEALYPACWVSGDEYMLEVLARNLIDNAIRYTPAGGTVEVNVAEKTGQVFLDVTDNGSGIPPEERSKVFGRFYRILGTGKSGSGLGLAIVERIARAHGATISLTDGENKRGLHVKVAFPSAP